MKRTLTISLATAATIAVMGGLALAGIEGSKHDFSNQAWSGGDTCGACHIPHQEARPAAAPLWDPNADLERRFGDLSKEKAMPGGGTLVCLRCHDGTIARDTTGAVVAARERFVNKGHPGLFATGHGSSDHPVGIEYPKIAKGFHSATSVQAKGAVLLPEGRVECLSCHDPHNEAGAPYMLVMNNDRSALCLTCHRK